MYSVYKQTHPPTGIEHCVYCNFFNTSERNLVIAAVNQLNVYRLNPDTEDDTGKNVTDQNQETRKKQKLECLATFSLFGNIMSLQFVKLPGANRDALLLSFSDAKLSVVEYDPSTHDLQTTSLHYFEEPALKDGFAVTYSIPEIRVDPDGRCAAMLIYGTRLVILPFRRDAVIEDSDISGGGKSPIMSSYIIDLKSFDEKITNVKDFQFLHGYYEPTVFMLYEPFQTWAGRTAVRADTCCIAAISLNIQERVNPVIWSMNNLPFDCCKVMAVPKPIGGVMVVAVNSLLYLNQSVPPYGVALNSIASSSTLFPLRTQEGIRIALDCSQAAFMTNDRLVLSLKGGELYVLTLVVDGMRSVRSFHFDKSAASVLTTCICVCEEGFLFLGSRLGNSLLLKYTEKAQDQIIELREEPKKEEPPTKKKKVTESEVASDVSQIENLYELEVYGSAENPKGTTIASYSFEVCDNIWNIAPCANIVMGEPAFLSEEFSGTDNPDIELVTTSGYSKNGALSVLQRTIRPQIVTTFELPGCIDMWTVKGELPEEEGGSRTSIEGETTNTEQEDKDSVKDGHAFLILSREDSSMILQTGQEIMELDHSGFSTQTATIFAGNIGDDKYIIQVSPSGVRLLEGVKQLQYLTVEQTSTICHCSVSDPYALLMTEAGMIFLLTLKQDAVSGNSRLSMTKPLLPQHSKILTLCTYKDRSGLFRTKPVNENEVPAPVETKPNRSSIEKVYNMDSSNVDDEDELLYGDTDTSVFSSSMDTSQTEVKSPTKSSRLQNDVKPTYWALVCRENGVLEIYSMPDFKLSYYVKNFPMGQKILVDSVQVKDKLSTGSSSFADRSDKLLGEMPALKEILMVGLGYRKTRPYLMARIEDDFYMYEAFPYFQASIDNHLKLRFKKVQHNLIMKDRKSRKKRIEDEGLPDETIRQQRVARLRYFEDVAGYSGVFVCGPYPHWIFMTTRGSLRIHPMIIDGPITCFSSFHNVNCPKGFLYFNKLGELRITVLPTHLTYDAPWAVRKIPLRCTPHFVAYHPDSKTYAVVTSTPENCNKLPKTTSEERDWDTLEKDERFIYPQLNTYALQLYSPTSWEVVPNTSVVLQEWEVCTTMKNVLLRSEENVHGFKSFLCMGTTLSLGEENISRGRILILDVIEVVPEPGMPLTKHKIKVLYDKEQKGPVTALAQIQGFLLTAIGQKLYIWQLKDNDLIGVAFIDTFTYINTLSTVKNIILAGDIIKSIALYRYQEELKVLSLVSRDIKPLETYTAEYMVDNSQLCFLVSDKMKNILMYAYHPEARESIGGQRLLRKADFNVGSHINSMFRVLCRSDPAVDKRAYNADRKHITYFASLDGTLGFVLPISEKVYRRLLMLQNAMTTQIQHIAGLNPRTYRAVQSIRQELRNPQKNILDGDLLWKYLHLSMMEKTEIAKRIGTSLEQLTDDLMDIDRLTLHF
ncbi:cleavage and polyadenylation specificity factor subunit 1-like [Mytilus trossulus]|uniref:cleavage and polyadenylation specificity factor subunit 1-like n=1 Tax=Mytilus trossulus TaxID=6551 RepID=UPI003006FFCF